MEIILGMLLGALLGGTTIYFLVKAKNKPEQQNSSSNSSRNLILKLIQSLPDIVIWVDGDNKIKYASEVALNLNIAREDKIQIEALETLISMARKIDEPLIKKSKSKASSRYCKTKFGYMGDEVRKRRSFTLGTK